jgi:hypothetical protein
VDKKRQDSQAKMQAAPLQFQYHSVLQLSLFPKHASLIFPQAQQNEDYILKKLTLVKFSQFCSKDLGEEYVFSAKNAAAEYEKAALNDLQVRVQVVFENADA